MASDKIRAQYLNWIGVIFSALFFIVSIPLGAWVGRTANSMLTNPSTATIQFVGAFQFLPMLAAVVFFSQYIAKIATTVPIRRDETIYRFEKAVVRGTGSVVVLIFGLGWWFWKIATVQMWAHPIFAWSTPFVVAGCCLSSWYYSKQRVYRGAVADSEQFQERKSFSDLPTLTNLVGTVLRGGVTLEFDRGGVKKALPTLMFKVSTGEESNYELNLGLEQLLPTIMAKKKRSSVAQSEQQLPSASSNKAEDHRPDLSLREIVRESDAGNLSEQALLLIHYAERVESKSGISIAELEDLFQRARMSSPANTVAVIHQLSEQDCIMEVEEGDSQKWSLTVQGADRVEMILSPLH